MDQAQQQLEQLEREYESIGRLESAYHTYNQYMMAERAQQWVRAGQKGNAAEKQVQELTKQYEELEKEMAQLTVDEQKYQQQKMVAELEKNSLQKHEVWSLEENKAKKQEEATTLTTDIRTLESKWDERNRKVHELWKEKEKVEMEQSLHERKAGELLEEMAIDGDESAFHQHEVNVEDYDRSQSDEFDFSVWLKEAKDHQSLLRTLEKLAVEAGRLENEHASLQRQSSDKKRVVDEHQKELDHLQEWFDEQHRTLESTVFFGWRSIQNCFIQPKCVRKWPDPFKDFMTEIVTKRYVINCILPSMSMRQT